MTENDVKIILDVTRSLREGIKENHDFSKKICDGLQELVLFITKLERRVRTIEENKILNGSFLLMQKIFFICYFVFF